ncbi:MAG TPA: nodulation protein NfeD [Candidatus Angelobacter sp.]|jgi:membrane-bound serine protease (ClpP class)|nr:nodulation protein NfeD [Candidatus Angelobacter sp.]
MTRSSLFKVIAALALIVSPGLASADVVKIVVDGPIHGLVTERFERAIAQAKATNADAVLVELQTPGGTMKDMEEIVHRVLESPVPVIIYVTPSGSGAASAGFFILESADVAAMAPGTNTGAAHPVMIGLTGSSEKVEPVMKEKVENYAASLLRSYETKRGRNAEIAETAVRQSKSFTAEEALSDHLIEYIAKDDPDLLRQLDGKTITRFDGSKVTMHVAGKPIQEQEMTIREKVLAVLLDPNISLFLFLIGALCIYFEFNHPGAVIPGAVGFVAVVLVLYAWNMLPIRSIAIVLILSSFVFYILEAKFQTHGILTTAGIVMMVIGALTLVDAPVPQMRVKLATALAVSIPFGLITVFLMTLAIRARHNKIVTGPESLVGEIGVVRSPMTPAGKVFVRGALWNAVSTANMDVGQAVIVRGVDNLVLRVEPATQSVTLESAKA